jgi:hypothetical protein
VSALARDDVQRVRDELESADGHLQEAIDSLIHSGERLPDDFGRLRVARDCLMTARSYLEGHFHMPGAGG